MNINMTLEVHYHQQDEASLFIESSNSGNDEMFGEILLFCSFTIRMLVNFGQSQTASSLALLLSEIDGNIHEIIDHDSPNGPRLVEYKGSTGRKQFIADLKCSDNDYKFNMTPKGFGLLGKGVDYYAANSVLLLLRYLAKRRIENESYISSLSQAAAQCGHAYYSGKLSMRTQAQIAFMITGGVSDFDCSNEIIPNTESDSEQSIKNIENSTCEDNTITSINDSQPIKLNNVKSDEIKETQEIEKLPEAAAVQKPKEIKEQQKSNNSNFILVFVALLSIISMVISILGYQRISVLEERLSNQEKEISYSDYLNASNLFEVISISDKGYVIINSTSGKFIVSVEDVTPYLDGFKVKLKIGNSTSITYNGLRLDAYWGSDISKVANSINVNKSYDLNNKLRPGYWNEVEITVPSTKAEEFKFLRLKIFTNNLSLIN